MNKKTSRVTDGEVQNLRKTKSGGALRLLLFAHLLLVTFQMPLRAMFFDTTYFRDILLVVIAIAGFLSMMVDKNLVRKQPFGLLQGLVALYLAYGFVVVLVCIYNGLGPVEAVRQFRNHFFPLILFFVAKKCLASSYDRAKLVNLYSFIAAVILLDVFVEYCAFLLGYSKSIFPWYSYQFVHSYRYVGNVSGMEGYIQPENSPLLGLLGWPHATSATFLALFAFICPFLWRARGKVVKLGNLVWCMRFPRVVKSLLILMAGIGVIILRVRMQMVSFLVLMFVLLLAFRGRRVFRILAFVGGFGIVVLVSDTLSSMLLQSFRSGFLGDLRNLSRLELILSFDIVQFFVSLPLWHMLFGWWGELNIAGTELRLLYFMLRFGLIWLFLFIMILIVGSSYARKIMSSRFVKPIDRKIAIGSICLLCVCFLDMGHYARTMYWPIIDILAVCLGALAATVTQSYDEVKHFISVPRTR